MACFFGSAQQLTSFVALDVLGTQSEQLSLSISSGPLGLKYNDCNGLVTFLIL